MPESVAIGANGLVTFEPYGAVTAFASAARTATPTAFDYVTGETPARGMHLVIDVTAIVSTPSVTFTIQGADPISGKFYTILASAAIATVSTTILRVYPGLTVAANSVASDVLTSRWRVIATHGNSNSITYTVAALLVP